MKFSANRDDLLKPLLMAGNIVERRQTLPILANILFKIQTGKLSITATDLEVEITILTNINVEEDAEFTLPARKLVDICKALPDGVDVILETEGEKATLRSGRGRYTMGMLAAHDYPNIEPSAASESLQIPEIVFKRLIDKTAFAMAQQDVRYYLNGLLLEIKPHYIRTVATDGHRLALCDTKFSADSDIDLQVILPRKAVIELGRLLKDSDANITLDVSNSHIHVQTGSTHFTSKLIDGRFPDYARVMPSGETFEISMQRDLLRQALTRTSILSNEKYRGIRFRLHSDTLQLQAHNSEQDEAEEELEVDYQGEELNIGFNVGYLLDVLSVIDTEQVTIALVDANSSAVITPVDSHECRYVVMPMRL